MKQEIKKQIIDALEVYMIEHEISQNEIARRTGVNASYIIDMRRTAASNNEHLPYMHEGTEISNKYFEKIANVVGFEIRKNYWKTQETEQLTEAMAELIDAKCYGYTRTIIGETGCGKSYAVELFQKKNPNDVFVVTISKLDSIGDIINKIVDALKITPAHTKSEKMKSIVKKLRELKLDGKAPLLIFDESEYMKQPALCAMKELYDNLNKHCGIVMVGHPQLIDNINKLRRKNKDGIPQLYRRIKFGIRHLAPIDRSYAVFLEGIDDKKLRKFLQSECENYGELHDVLVPAQREADRLGTPLTEQFVRQLFNIPEIAY